jgi:hypothetical protein
MYAADAVSFTRDAVVLLLIGARLKMLACVSTVCALPQHKHTVYVLCCALILQSHMTTHAQQPTYC